MNLIKYTPTLSYHVNEKQTVYFYVLFSLAFFTQAHPFPSLHTKTVAITYIPVYLYSSSIDMTMYWYASGLLTCCGVAETLDGIYRPTKNLFVDLPLSCFCCYFCLSNLLLILPLSFVPTH